MTYSWRTQSSQLQNSETTRHSKRPWYTASAKLQIITTAVKLDLNHSWVNWTSVALLGLWKTSHVIWLHKLAYILKRIRFKNFPANPITVAFQSLTIYSILHGLDDQIFKKRLGKISILMFTNLKKKNFREK